jgi:flagellar protein FlaJ
MQGNLQQYVLIFYFAQVILIVMVYILSTQLFPFMTGPGMQQIFGGQGMGDINYQQGFFHMLIINAMIGGVIIGKITEGSAKDGLKHSVILTIVSYLACVLIILPASGPVQATITVVSGDLQTGFVGMQLEHPIVFNVEDAQGITNSGTTVSFNIMPSGNVTPAFDMTDSMGNVSVKVTLGEKTGTYTVSATVGETVKTATVIATSE